MLTHIVCTGSIVRHLQAFAELWRQDGLIVMARGLGVRRLVAKFLLLHCMHGDAPASPSLDEVESRRTLFFFKSYFSTYWWSVEKNSTYFAPCTSRQKMEIKPQTRALAGHSTEQLHLTPVGRNWKSTLERRSRKQASNQSAEFAVSAPIFFAFMSLSVCVGTCVSCVQVISLYSCARMCMSYRLSDAGGQRPDPIACLFACV